MSVCLFSWPLTWEWQLMTRDYVEKSRSYQILGLLPSFPSQNCLTSLMLESSFFQFLCHHIFSWINPIFFFVYSFILILASYPPFVSFASDLLSSCSPSLPLSCKHKLHTCCYIHVCAPFFFPWPSIFHLSTTPSFSPSLTPPSFLSRSCVQYCESSNHFLSLCVFFFSLPPSLPHSLPLYLAFSFHLLLTFQLQSWSRILFSPVSPTGMCCLHINITRGLIRTCLHKDSFLTSNSVLSGELWRKERQD